MKPVLYVANVDETEILDNNLGKYSKMLFDYAEKSNNSAIRVCASIEQEISTLEDEEKELFLSEYNLSEP